MLRLVPGLMPLRRRCSRPVALPAAPALASSADPVAAQGFAWALAPGPALAAALAHVLFLFLVLLFFCVLLGLLTALLFVMASAAASAALFGSFFFELESIS